MLNYPAYICENGCEISTLDDFCSEKFCKKCGARVIHKCPECQNVIPGRSRDRNDYINIYDIPSYCSFCGKPYPWTRIAIESATLMVSESGLPYDEKQRIIEILPDAIAETPKTQIAAIRFKKVISGAEKFVSSCLLSFAQDYGCELLKKTIGYRLSVF